MKDDQHLNKVISNNSKIKNWLVNEINKLGLRAYETQTNFIFVIVPEKKNQNASLINDFLLTKGIAVRYLLSYGLENALRITIGSKDEMDILISNLKDFIKKNE